MPRDGPLINFAAMQAIVIPEMDFRDADLRDVILFLANASREMTTNPFQVGFIVKVSRPVTASG